MIDDPDDSDEPDEHPDLGDEQAYLDHAYRCLDAMRARTDGQLPNMRAIVGFAAETGDANGDVLFHARAKLRRKGCDLLVVNAVGENRAFEVDNNDGWLLTSDGTESALEHGSKTLMASRIVDAIVVFLHNSG